jgi:putative ABC transport system permease protein
MNTQRLIRANLACYLRFYKLIAGAVLILTAVITGSLLVGGSVRATLVNRVNERLGEDTETIVFARHAFFDHALAAHPLFAGRARAILLTQGFVSDAGRLLPVMVWGVDSPYVRRGGACVNPSLAAELSVAGSGSGLVVRLPATGLVPSGSLFVTDNYTTSARLNLQGVIGPEEGGNLSLRNEQTLPFNLFVNREELASILEVEGKINLLLSPARLSMEDLCAAWTPALSGLRVDRREGFTEVRSDRVFLPQDVVGSICANNPGANRLFSYLANEISSGARRVPYSFVTAVDSYKGKTLGPGELLLPDYTARRLNAAVNDWIQVTYYRSEDLKTLHTDTFCGRVAAILPLEEWVADPTLSADFPGLTDVERCTDWDSDLPVDMGLITQEDEDYWAQYRATPKAILPYSAVAGHWSNAYGSATGIRIGSPAVDMRGVQPPMLGLQMIYPREAGMEAARNGVDFSSLFLSLGFFIILSAALLMLVPLSEMIYVRREETGLLRALGYPGRQIVKLFRREAAPVVLIATLAGALAGLLYTRLILVLLGSLWRGATHSGGFMLYPDMRTLLAGGVGGFIISWILLRSVIGRAVNKPAGPGVISGRSWGEKLPFGRTRLIAAGLLANRRRAGLSFVTLASGVLIVFSVGLNRRGFTDRTQLQSGTGGYALWCESNVPVYHNIRTPAGRSRLALDALPEDVQALQLFRYGSDDASCLNLNKVSQPTVLGISMDALQESDFRIQRSIYGDTASVFNALQSACDPVYPVLIDETVLSWGLMLKLGDTLRYEGANGRSVYLQLAGTLSNSIFQGNLLIDKSLFSEIWSEITGSEVMLLKVSEAQTEETRRLLSQALSEYGVRVTTTSQRLREFNSVTDTYLTIFLTLGGLGLLLGIASLVIVIRKDLASRREQIRLYRLLGFPEKKIAGILSAENRVVPLCAIFCGVVGSLAGVSGGIGHVGVWIWLMSGLLVLFLVSGVILFIHQSVKRCLSVD